MVEEHKTDTIIVESTLHEWPKGEIKYAEVVTLEVPDYSQHPDITYSVKHKKGPATNLKGPCANQGAVVSPHN